MQSKFSKIAAVALAMTLLAVSFLPMGNQVAMAASLERCQNSDTGANGFLTWAIGAFMLQTNRWNTTNVTPNAAYNLCVNSDAALNNGDFEITVQQGSAPTNAGPTSYPSIIAGCHWVGVCSPVAAGMPIQYSAIASIPSNWSITTVPNNASNPNGGTWDASYDIWFNTTAVVNNPTSTNGQNNGAEVMIWLDSRGYSNQNANPPGTIRPTGVIQTTPFTAAGFTFDVWVGRLTGPTPDSIAWNVISFVRRNAPGNTNTAAAASSMIGFDAKAFTDYAATLDCPTTPAAKCINPNWFLLSVQAGFEPWAGGGAIKDANGNITTHGLTSKGFTVVANKKTGGPVVVTDRTTDDGRPIEHWAVPFTVTATGCPNSTPTLVISELHNATNPVPATPNVTVTGVANPAGSGNYIFNVPALFPMHGDVSYTVTFPAPCATAVQTTPGYIDPSGRVLTPAGVGISGATVTLSQLNTTTGAFEPVPAGSAVMSPSNRTNADTTGNDGSFGWDVLAGSYKVRAEKSGCVSPTNPAQTFVETGTLVVTAGHPVTDIDLRLNCPGGTGTGLGVVLTKTTDWTSGYCANVTVTNNTSAAVNWNVNFSLNQFGGGTIYTFWNAAYTQNGNQISNVRANPSNPWNKTLQPGESTHDVGFCANR